MDAPPELIDLKCRNCGAAISAADISRELGAARCGHCRSLFALPVSHAAAPAAIPRAEAAMPPGFTLDVRGDELVITRRWRNASSWFLLVFAIIWNGFMLVWHGIAIATGTWVMSVFGLIHTGVGLFLIYTVAAQFLNTSVIRASRQGLSVKSGPVPWWGDRSLPPGGTSQLYCTEQVQRGKNGVSITYNLEAVMSGNRRETLVRGLKDASHAVFIEQRIERHLGIDDRPVAGEHGR